MSPRKRPKPMSASKLARLQARTQVGTPRPSVEVPSRKDKPVKHKKSALDELEDRT